MKQNMLLLDINVHKKQHQVNSYVSSSNSGCPDFERCMFGMNTFNNDLHNRSLLEYNLSYFMLCQHVFD